mmetsp:Transcript_18659/g.53632  ORF Transcript_18659/g.53632 Transcript_18659/m.53632 type:complete len:203 (+) Transcript_18659:284-892(+)
MTVATSEVEEGKGNGGDECEGGGHGSRPEEEELLAYLASAASCFLLMNCLACSSSRSIHQKRPWLALANSALMASIASMASLKACMEVSTAASASSRAFSASTAAWSAAARASSASLRACSAASVASLKGWRAASAAARAAAAISTAFCWRRRAASWRMRASRMPTVSVARSWWYSLAALPRLTMPMLSRLLWVSRWTFWFS